MASALERQTRAARGTIGTRMVRMTLKVPLPRMATTARARMISGNERKMSMIRWMPRSMRPPK